MKFRDTNVPHLEDKLTPGRCLGQSTDIGPAMTVKTLKHNGQCARRTTFRGLTEDEVQDQDEDEAKARKLFDEEIEKPNPPQPSWRTSMTTKTTSSWRTQTHARMTKQEQALAPDQDDPPDDACDNCIGAELRLQKGNEAMTAQVKRRKLNEFGNAIGKANPIQSWTTSSACLSSKMERKPNIPQTLSQRTRGLSMTSKATSTNCWKQSLTTSRTDRQSNVQTAMQLSMVGSTRRRVTRDGNFASNGRMASQAGIQSD